MQCRTGAQHPADLHPSNRCACVKYSGTAQPQARGAYLSWLPLRTASNVALASIAVCGPRCRAGGWCRPPEDLADSLPLDAKADDDLLELLPDPDETDDDDDPEAEDEGDAAPCSAKPISPDSASVLLSAAPSPVKPPPRPASAAISGPAVPACTVPVPVAAALAPSTSICAVLSSCMRAVAGPTTSA